MYEKETKHQNFIPECRLFLAVGAEPAVAFGEVSKDAMPFLLSFVNEAFCPYCRKRRHDVVALCGYTSGGYVMWPVSWGKG